jgi:hypothetical protein
MADSKGSIQTPRVPIQTPLFNEPEAQHFTLTRTWIIFLERLFRGAVNKSTEITEEGGGAAGPYHRTLLIKDATIGNDIADHVTVWGAAGTITRVVGVLRNSISSDLTLRVKVNGSVLGTFTIPLATAVDTVVEFTTFSGSTTVALDDVFSWDITASDEQTDAAGVASFTVLWEPAA